MRGGGGGIVIAVRLRRGKSIAAAELQAAGIDARWIAADCAQDSEIARLADETLQRMGGSVSLANAAGGGLQVRLLLRAATPPDKPNVVT